CVVNGYPQGDGNVTPLLVVEKPASLADPEQFHLEHERGIGRNDASGAARAVAERGRDGELARAADLHALHALVPALDDVAAAEREYERVAAVLARIELRAVGEPAGVVDLDALTGGGERSVADYDVIDDETGGAGGWHGDPLGGKG